MKKFRLVDTGVLSAAENVAWDQAFLLAAANGDFVPTLRFLQYAPESVLVGRYQAVAQEVRIPFCIENRIDINRRITGGGAILFDATQLGWEIIAPYSMVDLPAAMAKRFRAICGGCISGLRELGLNANFRPMNDIEINKRKISGTGGIDEGEAFLFQGTLLIDFDAHKMIKSLRIPIEKLQDKEIESVKDRVTWIKKELGCTPPLTQIKGAIRKGFQEVFGVEFEPGEVTDREREIFESHKEYYASPAWVNIIQKPAAEKGTLSSVYKSKGGLIRTSFNIDTRNNIIQQAFITGDFFAEPKEAVYDFETLFKSAPAHRPKISGKIDDFFRDTSNHFLGITAGDMKTAVDSALTKAQLIAFGYTLEEANDVSTVVNDFDDIIQMDKIKLLLPYCSKQTGCQFRYEKNCRHACTACTVGQAAQEGLTNNVDSETITSFEDLQETLLRLKNNGHDAFIGCCCQAFLTKHRKDFEKIGLPGILIDIESETCYDLGLEQNAYQGKYQSQTAVKLEVLNKTLRLLKNAWGELKYD